MPRSVSPPISPKTIRRPKRSRQSSKSEISVQELSQDDQDGYDADIEVLRPDQYEEPETESDDDKPNARLIPDLDEEITRRMRQLGWRQPSARLQTIGHGQGSETLDSSPLNRYGKRPEFDVAELFDPQNQAHPAKRRKKRGSRSSISQRFMKSKPPVSDSSERTEGKQTPLVDTSTGSTGASEAQMDVGNDEMILD